MTAAEYVFCLRAWQLVYMGVDPPTGPCGSPIQTGAERRVFRPTVAWRRREIRTAVPAIADLFEAPIVSAQQQLEVVTAPRGRGRPSKDEQKAIAMAEQQLQRLEQARRSLGEFVDAAAGQVLAFSRARSTGLSGCARFRSRT